MEVRRRIWKWQPDWGLKLELVVCCHNARDQSAYNINIELKTSDKSKASYMYMEDREVFGAAWKSNWIEILNRMTACHHQQQQHQHHPWIQWMLACMYEWMKRLFVIWKLFFFYFMTMKFWPYAPMEWWMCSTNMALLVKSRVCPSVQAFILPLY